MAKNNNATEVPGTKVENEIAIKVKTEVVTSQGEVINFDTDFENKKFETSGSDLLSAEMLAAMKGMKDVKALIRKKGLRTIKEKPTEGVEIVIELADGEKTVFATQHKFVATFDEHDKGNGLLILFTVGEKIKLKNGRDMNEIEIKYAVL